MRHRNSGRQLSRTSSHRKAMFRNMMVSLLHKEAITTTLIKAKELRRFAEPMITLAKTDTVAGRRLAFSRLRSRLAVTKLFNDLGKFYAERPGGYLRILKCGFRNGDSAPLALVELVGKSERKALKDAKTVKPKKAKETKSIAKKAHSEKEEL